MQCLYACQVYRMRLVMPLKVFKRFLQGSKCESQLVIGYLANSICTVDWQSHCVIRTALKLFKWLPIVYAMRYLVREVILRPATWTSTRRSICNELGRCLDFAYSWSGWLQKRITFRRSKVVGFVFRRRKVDQRTFESTLNKLDEQCSKHIFRQISTHTQFGCN